MTRLISALVVFGGLCSTAAAQSTVGRITGVVIDQSRGVVQGAAVTVRNQATGVERTAVSGSEGGFEVRDLPPGLYTVAVKADGFAAANRVDVLVTMGASAHLNVPLAIEGVTETISLVHPEDYIDQSATSAGGLVTSTQIEELPLNGRNFLQLGALQPGVVVSRASGREFSGGFGTTQFSIAGARPEHTGYLLDGTNIADISDKAPSGMAGAMLGVDAVEQFSVQTHGYSAEFGRAAGGIISVVTKSGTNTFRASAFEFHRDSALDARGYFDPGEPPSFLRNQFGGTVGGPIARNRAFFFGSYEGLRSRNVVTRSARLPDANAHEGLLPNGQGGLKKVDVHPNVRPYLALLFPVPDGQNFGDGSAELRHSHRDPVDEDFFVTKGDWQQNVGSRFVFRYSRDDSSAVLSQDHPLFLNFTGTGTNYLTGQHLMVPATNFINEVRVAFNRTTRDDEVAPTMEIPTALYFTEDPHFGAINVIGLTQAGSTATIPASYDQRLFQVTDTMTFQSGAHTIRTGVDWQHYGFQGFSYSRYGGEFRFRNLEEFLTLRRSGSAQADRFTGNMPDTDTLRHMSQHYVAFFAQDEWRVTDSLTFNLGLRYEFVTTPKERDGLVAGLLRLADLESGPGGVTPGAPLFDNPSARSLAPRIGASWRPRPSTALRAGYGIFHQPLTVSYYRGTVFRIYPYFAGVDIRQPPVFGPGIQDLLEAGVDAQKRSEFIDYDARQPFVQQWHATVEQELGGAVIADVGYLGSQGHNLPFYGDPNARPSAYGADGRKRVIAGSSLRYPSWGRIRTRTNLADSNGHALVAGARQRTRDGLTWQAAYTYAHSSDVWSGGQMGTSDFDNGAGSATDWWDPEAERGPSNFDVRHSFVVNAVYELPWGRSLTGVSGVLARGWSVSGVLSLASGLPFTPFIGFDRALDGQSDADTIQKPDQVGAVRYPGNADEWFDVTAFALPPAGTYGSARRNSLRGPGLKLADVGLVKRFEMGRARLQFRLEAFNLFNWVNLGLPNAAVMFNSDGSYRAGAARITSTATAARQLQLGVKMDF